MAKVRLVWLGGGCLWPGLVRWRWVNFIFFGWRGSEWGIPFNEVGCTVGTEIFNGSVGSYREVHCIQYLRVDVRCGGPAVQSDDVNQVYTT